LNHRRYANHGLTPLAIDGRPFRPCSQGRALWALNQSHDIHATSDGKNENRISNFSASKNIWVKLGIGKEEKDLGRGVLEFLSGDK
jgi:hypothetical protein